MLLFVLLWVLAAALIFMYVITPLLEEKDDLDMELEFAQSDYDKLVSEAGKLTRLQAQSVDLIAQLAEKTERFYPVMTNAEADELVLTMLYNAGASAEIMNVSDPVPVEDGLIHSATDEAKDESETKIQTTSYSGILYTQLIYDVTLDYDELCTFISEVGKNDCLLISSIVFSQEMAEETSAEDGAEETEPVVLGKDMSATVTVCVLMYAK